MDIDNATVEVYGDTLHVEVYYPRHSRINTVEIGLCDVRAADAIRVAYDYDRDGWSILQSREVVTNITDNSIELETEWQEVAFVEVWALEPDHTGSDDLMDKKIAAYYAKQGETE